MSGLEVVGVVASILQIAEVGAKLSVKLCTFYRTVKATNQSLQGLSSDVSLTCSILNELGKALEQDDQARLCSQQAFCTAQEVLRECKAVFQQIEAAIEKQNLEESENNRFRRGARRITAAFHGPDLDVLKSHLERLKSTTLLMLHVIMYAAQIRKRKAKSTTATTSPLADQRRLIHDLLEEKKANDAQFTHLSMSLRSAAVDDDEEEESGDESTRAMCLEQRQPSLPKEMEEYHALIRKLLSEIDTCQYGLERSRLLRIRNGVVNVHSTEAALFRHIYGHAAAQLFDGPIFKLRDAWFSPTGSPSPNPHSETHRFEEIRPRPGPVAANTPAHIRDYYYRSKSRRRRRSLSRSRSRSLSHSHSRTKTFEGVDIGAAREAGISVVSRSMRRGRSRYRSRSRSRVRISNTERSENSKTRSESHRRKHMAGTVVPGAAAARAAEKLGYGNRSRSRKRKEGRSNSRSPIRPHPVVAAGVGTAAATGLYEKHEKGKETGSVSHRRRVSRSRSRGSTAEDCDASRGSPPYGSITASHCDVPQATPDDDSDSDSDSDFPYDAWPRGRSPRYSGRSSLSKDDEHLDRVAIPSWASDLSPALSPTSNIDIGVKPTPGTADNPLSQRSYVKETFGGEDALEMVLLEWTNLTREEIREE